MIGMHQLRSGGQGRNRTTDTRIFSTAESPVRREQAEGRGRVFSSADRTALPDRTYPEPERLGPGPRGAAAMSVNGLRAAGPNRFRTEHAAVPDHRTPWAGRRWRAGTSATVARWRQPVGIQDAPPAYARNGLRG